ncbi:MAG: hypothetical protein M5U28_01770 [Sandaracinaceae bacterium]|nr:hypothetical protein [Sandaracinaceae bacterium]
MQTTMAATTAAGAAQAEPTDLPAADPTAAAEGRAAAPARKHHYEWLAMVPWLLCHVAVLGAIWSGVTLEAVIVCAVLFAVRTFGVTGCTTATSRTARTRRAAGSSSCSR